MDLELSRDKIYDVWVGGAFRVKLFIVCIVLHFWRQNNWHEYLQTAVYAKMTLFLQFCT